MSGPQLSCAVCGPFWSVLVTVQHQTGWEPVFVFQYRTPNRFGDSPTHPTWMDFGVNTDLTIDCRCSPWWRRVARRRQSLTDACPPTHTSWMTLTHAWPGGCELSAPGSAPDSPSRAQCPQSMHTLADVHPRQLQTSNGGRLASLTCESRQRHPPPPPAVAKPTGDPDPGSAPRPAPPRAKQDPGRPGRPEGELRPGREQRARPPAFAGRCTGRHPAGPAAQRTGAGQRTGGTGSHHLFQFQLVSN